MKRIVITIIVCLAIAAFGIHTGNAAEPLKNCGNLDPMFIDVGDIIDCGIIQIGDSRNFKFDASEDDKIRLTMTDRTPGSPAPYLGLYDPDGVLTSYWYVQDSGSHNDYSLTKTGRYTIVVWEYADNEAVAYRLSFNCILGECVECADFYANPTRGPFPLTVSFTDQSTGSNTSWEWDFGDGSTSTKQNPSHTYTEPGTYTVSLTVTGYEGSDTNTKADYIKVWSPAKAMPWLMLLLDDDK
jgi:hypothetical protein